MRVEKNIPCSSKILAWPRMSCHRHSPHVEHCATTASLVRELPRQDDRRAPRHRANREPTTMIDLLLKAFLSCSHRRLGFPITVKHGPHLSGSRYGRRTYVICLDCGAELPYSWDDMRIEKTGPAFIDARARQLSSWFESVRAAWRKGVHLDIRCKLARDRMQQKDHTWRIRIGRPFST